SAVIGGIQLGNDSYQYLSVARHLAHGEAETSIIHFDVERESGRLPSPITTFPLVYPAVVAVVHAMGLKLRTQAVLVSVLAFVATVRLLYFLARLLRMQWSGARLAAFLWIATSWAGYRALTIGSESLFTALTLLALALIVYAEGGPPAHR